MSTPHIHAYVYGSASSNPDILSRPSACPLLLFHAMPVDGKMWEETFTFLPDVPALAVNAPGFGQSLSGEECQTLYGDGETPSLESYAHATAALLTSLNISHVAPVGISMGGAAAAAFAHLYPHMTAGIALMDTNINADSPERAEARRAQAAHMREGGHLAMMNIIGPWVDSMVDSHASSEEKAQYLEYFSRAHPRALAWLFDAMAERPDLRSVVSSITGPILLVRGESDPTCSQAMMSELESRARYAHTLSGEKKEHDGNSSSVCRVSVPHAGHFTPMESPRATAHLLRNFAQECAAHIS